MPEEHRKLVEGWGERTAGCYGRMQDAAYFKNLTRELPEEIASHLDKIPLTGAVASSKACAYLEGLMAVQGIVLGTATRLLCMKRPDLFLSANSASLANNKFGTAPNTINKYIGLVERVWQLPWFAASHPKE